MKSVRVKGNSPAFRYYAIWSAVLLCVCAIGFGYWKARQPEPAPASPVSSPETRYYTNLVYAVNEMHNQVEKYETLRQQGAVPLAQLQKEEAYADQLMAPLNHPPEELSVAQYIADQLYQAYQQYLQDVKRGAAAPLENAYQLVNHNVELFRQNANLITVLNAYSGVNVYCH